MANVAVTNLDKFADLPPDAAEQVLDTLLSKTEMLYEINGVKPFKPYDETNDPLTPEQRRVLDRGNAAIDAVKDGSEYIPLAGKWVKGIFDGIDASGDSDQTSKVDIYPASRSKEVASDSAQSDIRNIQMDAGVPYDERALVTTELMEPPHDDLYNAMLHASKNLVDEQKDGVFERMHNMAETQAGDDAKNSPGLLNHMRKIESGEYGDLTSAQKLDKLQELSEQSGHYNPRGDGQLHHDDKGNVIRDPDVVKAEHDAARENADASPFDRANARADVGDRTVELTPYEAKLQLHRDIRELMEDPNASEEAKALYSDPRVVDAMEKTINAARHAGHDGIEMRTFETDTPEGRLTSLQAGLNVATRDPLVQDMLRNDPALAPHIKAAEAGPETRHEPQIHEEEAGADPY